MVDKNGLTTRQSRWLGNSYNDYEITFEDKVYKVLHQKGSWDIFAIFIVSKSTRASLE